MDYSELVKCLDRPPKKLGESIRIRSVRTGGRAMVWQSLMWRTAKLCLSAPWYSMDRFLSHGSKYCFRKCCGHLSLRGRRLQVYVQWMIKRKRNWLSLLVGVIVYKTGPARLSCKLVRVIINNFHALSFHVILSGHLDTFYQPVFLCHL